VPSVSLACSPLAGGAPASVSYREAGSGAALIFLHGGWGYEIYPLELAGLAGFRVIIPDRSGYGRSTPVEELPPDFHRRAMWETVGVLDALGIERAVWWGHSDGAVIAAWAGIEVPHRTSAVVLESLHFTAVKPRSRAFFEQMATDPDAFGPRIGARLAAEHGADRWRDILRLDGHAWLDLAASAEVDLFGGRLSAVAAPAMVIHGGQDPRTEPGELAAIMAALPGARLSYHAGGRHSPHSESAVAEAVLADVADFVTAVTV